ncbi:hypothetical protein B0O99DRAFT_695932 [Bisporella sp. PMI_857]|nr:hypothetical protein B0O99DRAFT_695932 [Bisporella sp. PMI_857]
MVWGRDRERAHERYRRAGSGRSRRRSFGSPSPSLERDKYSPSPPTTGGSPSRDYEKNDTHEPDHRADSERSSSVENHEERNRSEYRERKQIEFAPGTKEPPQNPHEQYSRDIEHGPDPARQISREERSFFTALSQSLYEQEIYGEFDYPSGALRYLSAIGIKPGTERTKLTYFVGGAIENYKKMCEYQFEGEDDPFILDSQHGHDFYAMVDAELIDERSYSTFRPRDRRPYDGSRGAKNNREVIYTFFMALLGGSALLAPMVLMILKKSLHLTVITVCVSVVIVSGALALFSRKSAFEILGLTAAYAAVLVVFVGASS